jgi:hypothetical protein
MPWITAKPVEKVSRQAGPQRHLFGWEKFDQGGVKQTGTLIARHGGPQR